MIVQYVRKENREPYGVVVATDPDHFGFALCNPKDKFTKKKGLKIALTRASSFTKEEALHYAVETIPEKRFQNFNWVWDKVETRASKYFKTPFLKTRI